MHSVDNRIFHLSINSGRVVNKGPPNDCTHSLMAFAIHRIYTYTSNGSRAQFSVLYDSIFPPIFVWLAISQEMRLSADIYIERQFLFLV